MIFLGRKSVETLILNSQATITENVYMCMYIYIHIYIERLQIGKDSIGQERIG